MSDAERKPPAVADPQPERRRTLFRRFSRLLLFAAGSVVALLLILIAAAVIILPSGWFREKVRTRMIYEIERASGGRTEVGQFRFDWTNLTAEVAPFVLHGTEPPGADPLFSAASIKVDLKVVSMMKRDVDLASVVVDRPQLNLLVDENGITNFPKPKVQRPGGRHPVERLVSLAIRDIALKNGTVHYGDEKIPLDVQGHRLSGSLDYHFANPSYRGELKIDELTVDPGPALPMTFAFDSKVALFPDKVEIERAVLTKKDTTIEFAGTVEEFRKIRMNFDVRANGDLAELGPPLRLPKPHVGHATFNGKFNYNSGEPVLLTGRATGQHLAVQQGRVNVQDISLTTDVRLQGNRVLLTDTTVHALDGVFRGMVTIEEFKRFKINGKMTGVSIRSLARMAGLREAEFAGTMNGPVEVTGSFDTIRNLRAGGRFDVEAAQEGVPVNGSVNVAFNGRAMSVQLGDSRLVLPSSTLEFTGVLGERLRVRLESRDLSELLPALAMFSENTPKSLPLELRKGGAAVFEGTVAGPLNEAKIAGELTLTNFSVRNQAVDRLVARLEATESRLHVSSFALGHDTMRLAGSFDAALQNWKLADSSTISSALSIKNARVAKLLADAGEKIPIEGLLNATADVSGTVENPQATIKLEVAKPVIYGERFDRIHAELRYQSTGVEIIRGAAEIGSARVLLSGVYQHPENDWKNGRLRFDVSTQGWGLQTLETLAKVRQGIGGTLAAKAAGIVEVRNGEIFPAAIDGTVNLNSISVEGRTLGNFEIDAKTSGPELNVALMGNLRGSKLSGKATVQLAGGYPANGEVSFSPITFSAIQDLVKTVEELERRPFDGYVAGRITFSGPLKKPEQMRAEIHLPTLQVVPARKALTARQVAELALRNAEPVVIAYKDGALNIVSGHMVGRDTDLRVTGTIGLGDRRAWDLRVNGNLNLGVLQDFNEDLVSSGLAVINASVRGPLRNPDLAGRMDLKNASLYLADVPNGLDDINGTVLFDDQRATIERLTAKTGGGDLAIAGFVGFQGEITYQIQARADSVRIRYPEGVSTTANATLSLTGTSSRSLLSGVVTVLRASFNPRTDLGGLLASAPVPVAAPAAQNEFLRTMQFDIRVETVPNLQIQTSLTRDLQAEADLRVRGTAARPVVLGRVVVNQGEIQFFGNRYTINRGEISFFNPVRIEPVIDMDLETQVRGVTVTINFNGPLRKLNVSYRSDPPLQPNDIVALLAVGRAPGTSQSLAVSQAATSQGVLGMGGNTLLGQALAAPISGRLQRFFGVSRIKIDPQLTGLSAVPQARLTVEQQISRDVTLTYVTNLSQANQQIIRLEWDISRTWSVVAVREENGVFGVDFLFKRRFH